MKIVPSSLYAKRISELLTGSERADAENEIAADPTAWPVIRHSGGARKARAARGARGKSGGVRIIYHHAADLDTLYLWLIFPKSEQENLTDSQLKAVRTSIETVSALKDQPYEEAKPVRRGPGRRR